MANTGGMGFNWKPYLTGGAARPDAISGLNSDFSASLARMIQEAPAEVQAQLRLTSAYRSPQRQAEILTDSLTKRVGPEAAAKWQGYVANAGGDVVAAGEAARPWLRQIGITKWVAPPGSSNHQKGEAVDFKYLDPAATQYMHQNAGRYGLNFPLSNEDWHIEPAGARGGGSPGSMMAQVQSKQIDPIAEVVAAAGSTSMPQAVAGSTGTPSATTVASDVPATPPATADASKGLLGIEVPKGLPAMLQFSALAMNQQQPQDDTPRGGLLQSQPVQVQQLSMGKAKTYKPWEQYLGLLGGRLA